MEVVYKVMRGFAATFPKDPAENIASKARLHLPIYSPALPPIATPGLHTLFAAAQTEATHPARQGSGNVMLPDIKQFSLGPSAPTSPATPDPPVLNRAGSSGSVGMPTAAPTFARASSSNSAETVTRRRPPAIALDEGAASSTEAVLPKSSPPATPGGVIYLPLVIEKQPVPADTEGRRVRFREFLCVTLKL
jgi:hypothetical protein